MRTPNAICSECGTPCYKRPVQLAYARQFCSRACFLKQHKAEKKTCPNCGKSFTSEHKKTKYCSKSCGNSARRGMSYTGTVRNATVARLAHMQSELGEEVCSQCMVEGCDYGTTLDIHRLLPGKEGGEYVIGNMFLVCPNHHAEVTRNITEYERVNDYTLRKRGRVD